MPQTTDTPTEQVASAAALLTELASHCSGRDEDVARVRALLAGRSAARGPAVPGAAVLDAAGDLALLGAVDPLWARGWTPRDVLEVVRRRLGAGHGPLIGDVLVADARRRPAGWSTDGVDAELWWDLGRPLVTQWRSARGRAGDEALDAVVRLVGELRRLPALPTTGPVDPEQVPGIDPKVLARVRGLLAKAESTSFPEEAEALSEKAQELMARHALARAVVDAGRGPGAGRTTTAVRRLWLDAPYTSAKSSLVHEVAVANRCRAVGLAALDLVTVVGHPPDLDTVELLVTSLLVQAARAMVAEGPRASRGRSRTRSFRHAFLLSYATRIGERLRAAGSAAERAVRAEAGDDLLPVLAARSEAVERTVADLFPAITTKRFTVGNAAGWHAGREAADAASLRVGRDALDR